MSSLNVAVIELAPQLVAGILKHVTIDELEAHVQESPRRLEEFAQSQGGEIAGSAFGIFHGSVSETDNGPMEVCVPVKGTLVPSGDVVLREMPGGKAVCVVGGGEYCHFPKVLELYDSACDWARQNGYEVVGPPRELWSGPNGEACTLQVVWLIRERSVPDISAGPGGAGSRPEDDPFRKLVVGP